MSMSKKDFIALADEMRPVLGPGEFRQIAVDKETVMDALCRFMSRQNPQFKEDRWRAYLAGECGPGGGAIKAARKL